jgi:hypothetical protein
MSDEEEPTTNDEDDESQEQDWESIGKVDIDGSDCDTVVGLEEFEDISTTAGEGVMKSVDCSTEDLAGVGAAFIDYDDSLDDVIMENVELEELLEMEKDNAEQDSILDPASTNDSASLNTDTAPSTAPFYPPGLILPTPGSALELPFDAVDYFGDYSEDCCDIEPNVMGVPVLMTTAELSQGELWLYGEQYLAQYRCRNPSPLRICWTSIWV